jgi:phosphoketolase
MVLGLETEHPHGLTAAALDDLFTPDRLVVFNFHGYPGAIEHFLFGRPSPARFRINGYQEEGTTTTPFDMHVRNGTSRYHLVMQAAQACPALGAERVQAIVERYHAEAGRAPDLHRGARDRPAGDPGLDMVGQPRQMLVLNSGSSSLKLGVFDWETLEQLASESMAWEPRCCR